MTMTESGCLGYGLYITAERKDDNTVAVAECCCQGDYEQRETGVHPSETAI